MSEGLPFVELIRRVRAGDEKASTELVRLYEPIIRVAVHVRLNDPGLRRLFDSMDICQSVLGNFFVRAAAGQFELERPGQLIKLLVTMARNRVTNHALQQQAARRDHRRREKTSSDCDELIDHGPSPSEVVSGKELLEAFRGRLSPDEREVAELRTLGQSWPEIAAKLGGTPNALRVRLDRALDRVTRELRLLD
ncbi:MAG TPA: sigma-70 family RNA polymerase sigma factor [Gemmataceae bacterium]|nr:sigma-70 family RNA polymerase sigma factor [Gemmataceae bacterium]